MMAGEPHCESQGVSQWHLLVKTWKHLNVSLRIVDNILCCYLWRNQFLNLGFNLFLAFIIM